VPGARIRPPGYAELLRTLGAELEAQGAQGIVLSEGDEGFLVSWAPPDRAPQARNYRKSGLFHLAELARAQRSSKPAQPALGYAELLRTLGQLLEQDDLRLFSLTEDAEGFWIQGLAGGHDVRRWYGRAELESASRAQRPPPPTPARE
jgi:hypothetical protein